MATLDELQAQLAALTQQVNEITTPPDDYYTHRFSGEEIDNAVDRVKATPGSGAITAGDIGAAPAPLSSSITLYVNGTAGNDNNPGTKSEPFRTLQAAINSVPKNLGGYSVSINIVGDVGDTSTISILGFYGGSIIVSGDSSNKSACGVPIIISQCTAIIKLFYFTFSFGLSSGQSYLP